MGKEMILKTWRQKKSNIHCLERKEMHQNTLINEDERVKVLELVWNNYSKKKNRKNSLRKDLKSFAKHKNIQIFLQFLYSIPSKLFRFKNDKCFE